MALEVLQPQPLSGEEVIAAVLFKIGAALLRSCNLRAGDAYSAFSAEVTVRLHLNDYGREVEEVRTLTVAEGELDVATAAETVVEVPIAPAPPNQVRIETMQDVPVRTVEDGKTVIKKVKYAARRGQGQARSK